MEPFGHFLLLNYFYEHSFTRADPTVNCEFNASHFIAILDRDTIMGNLKVLWD